MREKIRLPADVELSIALLSLAQGSSEPATENGKITIEKVAAGKFDRVVKVTIELPGLGDCIVIYPKERKANV